MTLCVTLRVQAPHFVLIRRDFLQQTMFMAADEHLFLVDTVG